MNRYGMGTKVVELGFHQFQRRAIAAAFLKTASIRIPDNADMAKNRAVNPARVSMSWASETERSRGGPMNQIPKQQNTNQAERAAQLKAPA
jgi:hypothetical protein